MSERLRFQADHLRRVVVGAWLAAGLALTAAAAEATEAWRARPVTLSAASAPLQDVLSDVAAAAGLRARLDPNLSGDVTFKSTGQRADVVLDSLAARYGFDWWYDGASLLVSPASASLSRLVRFQRVEPDELVATLRALGLFEPRFKFRAAADGLGYVNGPASYIAVVELVLADLEAAKAQSAAAQGATTVVRTIKWGRVGAQSIDAE